MTENQTIEAKLNRIKSERENLERADRSRIGSEMDPAGLAILQAFGEGSSQEEVFSRLSESGFDRNHAAVYRAWDWARENRLLVKTGELGWKLTERGKAVLRKEKPICVPVVDPYGCRVSPTGRVEVEIEDQGTLNRIAVYVTPPSKGVPGVDGERDWAIGAKTKGQEPQFGSSVFVRQEEKAA